MKKILRTVSVICIFLAFMAFGPGPAGAWRDPTLLPERAGTLVPFEPLRETLAIYLPGNWAISEGGTNTWRFADTGSTIESPIRAELRTGPSFRRFREFADEVVPEGGQERVLGPIGFPDRFDDTRERYIVHFIRDGRMLTAIYGSVVDGKRGTNACIELLFHSDAFDYYDALSYTIVFNVGLPGSGMPREIGTYRQWRTVYECYGLNVPPGQKTPEEAVSSYYSCLITNRWEKARKYLSPAIDRWPPCHDIAYKERSWWALKWFRLLFMRYYEDRVECAVLKDVRQLGDDQEGVDYVTVRKTGNRWYIASFP